MVLTKKFEEKVYNHDLLSVRIMIKDSLLADPTFNKFDEMISFAEKNIGPTLWESLEGDIYDWNKEPSNDALDKELVLLVENFNKDRVKTIKKMIEILYPQGSHSKRASGSKVKRAKLSELEDEIRLSYKRLSKLEREALKYKQPSIYREAAVESKKLSELLEKCSEEKLKIIQRMKGRG